MEIAKIGDMVYNKFIFNGLWHTVGLNDRNDPSTKCLFPNIIMDEPLNENGNTSKQNSKNTAGIQLPRL